MPLDARRRCVADACGADAASSEIGIVPAPTHMASAKCIYSTGDGYAEWRARKQKRLDADFGHGPRHHLWLVACTCGSGLARPAYAAMSEREEAALCFEQPYSLPHDAGGIYASMSPRRRRCA